MSPVSSMTAPTARPLTSPLNPDALSQLHAGDAVTFTGTVYTARDAAHRRMCEALDAGKPLPFELENAVIYYAGPAPARPGAPIGPCGPTTSYRMDPYAPRLLDLGLRAMIGKGTRSDEVREAIVRNKATYFAAVGGAAARIARCVRSAEIVAYEDLGAEAVRRLEVVDMPLTVVVDVEGNDLYQTGPAAYLASLQG